MDAGDRPPVATFYSAEQPVAGSSLTLGREVAHHARVRRLQIGDPLVIVDGAGTRASATLRRLAKSQVNVEVRSAEHVEPATPVHLLVPIADRDRMLWLAEKSTELGATSWRPVLWRRSKSVSPRGEGMTFREKVRARMAAALEQSGGAWMPALYPDAKPEHAAAATPDGTRLLLDACGAGILSVQMVPPVSIAVGPEGGVEEEERGLLVAAGFTPVSIPGSILRFETAAVAALAVVRSVLATNVISK